jgi:hypothetical protein
MSDLVFYRQKRYDGGVRTGVEWEGMPLARHFDPPAGDRDPALLWFVDLRCSGPGIPNDPDAAFDWLGEQTSMIREGFRRFGEKLLVGADHDDDPLEWTDFGATPVGVALKLVCSATRRVDARDMSGVINDIGFHWSDYLNLLVHEQEAEGAR